MATITWNDVKQAVEAEDYGKRDKKLLCNKLEWIGNGNGNPPIICIDGEDFFVSEWAEMQICNKLGIPLRYWKKCPVSLQQKQFDYWKNYEEREWLLRFKNDVLRGVLSDKYETFDNKQVIKLWEDTGMTDSFNYELMLTDNSFYLRAIYGNGETAVGDLKKGVWITNSEVGRRAVSVDASIWRLACSNGLIVLVEDKPLMYKRHIWIKENVLVAKFKQAVMDALMIADKKIEELKGLKFKKADEEYIQSIGKNIFSNDELVNAFRNEFFIQNDFTMFGVVNAITATAKKLPPDDRYEVEAKVGRLLAA